MGQPYVGEIRMFGGSFAPAGWAFCNGQLMPISENDTLFNLIGTTYGGDGQETFALPNLQSRFPVHMGTSPQGITTTIGESFGTETVTLTSQQIPSHRHTPAASTVAGSSTTPVGNLWAANSNTASAQFAVGSSTALNMNPAMLSSAGGDQPHENMPPFLCISFIISLFGVYPSPT